MTISATEGVTGPFGPTSTTGVTGSASEDKDMFLQLLVAQLRYQDPMNPADSSEFLSQSAQFTSLEKMQAVADQTGLLLGASMAFGASGLVGRTVSYTLADQTQGTGVVQGVTFTANGPVLDVGGTQVPISAVLTVTDGTGTASTGTTPSA